jgi:hypothetical protein
LKGTVPSGLAFLSFFLAILASPFSARAADEPSVGMVTKVQNEAEVVSSGGTTTAIVGTVLHMKDELRTGADGRLQVTFRDKTSLILGENASVVIDRYVFDPDAGVGEVALNAAQGAFRFATGQIGAISGKKVTISTPVAQIGVRGTEFWHGPLDKEFCLLLLKPAVTCSNPAGSVALDKQLWGSCTASSSQAPGAPSKWPADKVARALESTSTQPGPGHHGHIHHGENNPGGPSQNYAVNPSPPSPIPFLAAVAGVGGFAAGNALSSTSLPASP